MRRREFITLVGGMAASWPHVARGQQATMRRVGVLMGWEESDRATQSLFAAFRDALAEAALFNFLDGRRYFARPATQLNFQLDQRTNLILCGYTCSGKTTASQHLARRFGYLHIEASDFMHLSYYYRHGFRSVTTIDDFAESALAQQPTIAAEKVVEYYAHSSRRPDCHFRISRTGRNRIPRRRDEDSGQDLRSTFHQGKGKDPFRTTAGPRQAG